MPGQTRNQRPPLDRADRRSKLLDDAFRLLPGNMPALVLEHFEVQEATDRVEQGEYIALRHGIIREPAVIDSLLNHIKEFNGHTKDTKLHWSTDWQGEPDA